MTSAPPIPSAKPRDTLAETAKSSDANSNLSVPSDKIAPVQTQSRVQTADRVVLGVGARTAMTADLQAMLISMIKPCWSPPVDAPNPEDLIVDFDLVLSPNGFVARPPRLLAPSSATTGSPYLRAAAEAALRAIYTCAPFRLPADHYSEWREIDDFRFDPHQNGGG